MLNQKEINSYSHFNTQFKRKFTSQLKLQLRRISNAAFAFAKKLLKILMENLTDAQSMVWLSRFPTIFRHFNKKASDFQNHEK